MGHLIVGQPFYSPGEIGVSLASEPEAPSQISARRAEVTRRAFELIPVLALPLLVVPAAELLNGLIAQLARCVRPALADGASNSLCNHVPSALPLMSERTELVNTSDMAELNSEPSFS